MYFSINRFTGDGTTTQWEFNFSGGYIDQAHVKVLVTDPLGVETIPTYTWVGPNTISIVPAVVSGSTLEVYRDTPKNLPLVDYTDGAIVSEKNLDTTAEQSVFVAAEVFDRFSDTANLVVGAATAAVEAAELAAVAAGTAASDASSAQGSASNAAVSAAAAQAALENIEADLDALVGGDFSDFLRGADNLSDVANATAARINLGLGNVDNIADVDKPVSTAQAAAISSAVSGISKASLGLGNVDNTSDVAKPVSTAQAAAIAVAEQNVIDTLTASSGSNIVGFQQAGIGAVVRTAQDKMRDVVSVKDFGAVGDSVTDDTHAIQSALDSGATWIFGGNAQYLVTTLFPRSNQKISDLRLLAKPSAAPVSLRPVIKIAGVVGGTVQQVENVTIENVRINGNRQNLSEIITASGEDGGMHGIKISDGAKNIRILDCSADYCGTAGVAIRAEIDGPAATYPVKEIYIDGLSACHNREHGMFADSFDGVFVNRANLSYNGSAIQSGFPVAHGNSAFLNPGNGLRYGSGIDLECYAGVPSTYFKNFFSSDLTCIGNATECMVYAPPVVDAVAEIPAQNLSFKNVWFEKGNSGASANGFSLTANSHVGTKYGIDRVLVSGFIDGPVFANNVKGFVFSDGSLNVPDGAAYKALVNNSKNHSITVPSNIRRIQVQTLGALSVVKDSGAGALTADISQFVNAQGGYGLIIPISISGGTIAGGAMSWTITLPTDISAISANVNAWNSASGAAVTCSVDVVSQSVLRVFITPIDDAINGTIDVFCVL